MTAASLLSRPAGGAGTPADPLAAYRIAREPYYRTVGGELALFEAAHALRLPLMLKGAARCRVAGCTRLAR
jgi:nitric oxide reductase NorQ protein